MRRRKGGARSDLQAVGAAGVVEDGEERAEQAARLGGARDVAVGAQLRREVEARGAELRGAGLRLGPEDRCEEGERPGLEGLLGAGLAAGDPVEAGDAGLRNGTGWGRGLETCQNHRLSVSVKAPRP